MRIVRSKYFVAASFVALGALLSLTAGHAAGPGTIVTVAGGGVPDDGAAPTNAGLSLPSAVVVDGSGNLYIADTDHCVVRRVATGVISTFAGNGLCTFAGEGGTPSLASLDHPSGLAFDNAGDLYISDSGNCRIRKVIAGTIVTVVGNATCGFAGDGGPATQASLHTPRGIAFDGSGALYIADADNCEVRRVAGGIISTIAGSLSCGFSGDGGLATSARFNTPISVAVDASGGVLIADFVNCEIRRVMGGTVTAFAGTGVCGFSGDFGQATNATLGVVSGIAVRGNDVYIADAGNCTIRKVTFGSIISVPGTVNGCFRFNSILPVGMAFDAGGNLYVPFNDYTPAASCVVNKLVLGSYNTVAGNGYCLYGGDGGPAASAGIAHPAGIALDSANNIYIADRENCRIRKVSLGVISTVAGNGLCDNNGEGGPATSAGVNQPIDVAVDSVGTIYIAEAGSCRLRQVSGGLITTLFTYGGLCPYGLAVDASNNLYISDRDCRVREWSGGAPILIAGTSCAAYNGDNIPATSASLNVPRALAVDAGGNVYIDDTFNCRIRKVSGGTITTVVGNGGCSSGPLGGGTRGVAIDGQGTLYITEDCAVRKVSGGTITTLAGSGACGFGGDGGPAASAKLFNPIGVAADPVGNVYIADTLNQRIRKVSAPPPPAVGGSAEQADLRQPPLREASSASPRIAAAFVLISLSVAVASIAIYTRRRRSR